MKKHIIIISMIVFLSLGAISFNVADIKNDTVAVTTQKEKETYILKDYNGKIALYKNSNNTPDEVFDIFTDSLPESDAKSLKQGITASTEQELQKLIENYLS